MASTFPWIKITATTVGCTQLSILAILIANLPRVSLMFLFERLASRRGHPTPPSEPMRFLRYFTDLTIVIDTTRVQSWGWDGDS